MIAALSRIGCVSRCAKPVQHKGFIAWVPTVSGRLLQSKIIKRESLPARMMIRLYWILPFSLVITARKSPARATCLPRIAGTRSLASRILNSSSGRLLAICQLLSRPPYAHHDIQFNVVVDKPEIFMEHKSWGSWQFLCGVCMVCGVSNGS